MPKPGRPITSFDTDPEWRAKETTRKKKWRDKRKASGVPVQSNGNSLNPGENYQTSFSILHLYAVNFVRDYLNAHPCIECGYSNPLALEFDHVRGKKIETVPVIADGIPGRFSLEDLTEEIKKCEVRCANCHRVRHRKNGYKQ